MVVGPVEGDDRIDSRDQVGSARAWGLPGDLYMANLLRSPLLLLVFPLTGAVAATYFCVRHGFGGGHGQADSLIWMLGMPGIWVVSEIDWFAGIDSAYLLVVLIPAAINLFLWSLPAIFGGLLACQSESE